jgi:hypothetical protein
MPTTSSPSHPGLDFDPVMPIPIPLGKAMLPLAMTLNRLCSPPAAAVFGRFLAPPRALTGGRDPNVGGAAVPAGFDPEPKGGGPDVGAALFGLVGCVDDIGLNEGAKEGLVCVPPPMPGARLRRRLTATTSCISASGSSVISSGAMPSPLTMSAVLIVLGASERSLLSVATELPDWREVSEGGRSGVMGPALRWTCAAAGRRTKTFIDSADALVGVSAILMIVYVAEYKYKVGNGLLGHGADAPNVHAPVELDGCSMSEGEIYDR